MNETPNAVRRVGAGIAIGLHALAIAWLLAYEPARTALLAAAPPILVELIAPPQPLPQQRPPPSAQPARKPTPRPLMQPAPEPAPILSAPPEATPSQRAVAASPSVPVAVAPAAPAPVVAAPPAPPAPPAPVTPPVFNAAYLENPPPAYPSASRRLGEEGRVMLRVLVNAAGRAEDVQIQTSSGHARLDEAAREAVRRWRFVPARRGGEAVPWHVLVPIHFQMDG